MIKQFNQNILAAIKAVVEKTFNSKNNTSQSRFSSSSKSINSSGSQDNENANNEKIKGNSKNIEFFDFNYDGKFMTTKKLMTHIEKKIYYKNVHIFVKKNEKNDNNIGCERDKTKFINMFERNCFNLTHRGINRNIEKNAYLRKKYERMSFRFDCKIQTTSNHNHNCSTQGIV